MKVIIVLFFFILTSGILAVQQSDIDSLKNLLHTNMPDSPRIKLLTDIAEPDQWHRPDTAIKYAMQAWQPALKSDNPSRLTQDSGSVLSEALSAKGNYSSERANLEGFKSPQGVAPHLLTVTGITGNEDKQVSITVSDNGHGIPEKIKDKVFQPFFTTKPTGQGTGLGLSLSYDIIKAHGGEMRVESKEGIGTCFIVGLPLKENS
ncbi:MAG: hypothetical protein H3C36_09725 [Chitinophagaceae bacterium]|nr:hypothetical protein [Chitinophagaceae bacterium]MCW5914718.1 hypothetical protein [Chitinophagaceae bacterium]